MKHEIWFDEDNEVLRFKLIGQWTVENFKEAMTRIQELFEGKEHRYLIGDVSQASPQKYTKEFRQLVAEEGANVQLDKAAITGASPVLRMMAKMLIAAGRVARKIPMETRFFKTDEEAVEWLKGKVTWNFRLHG
ncbi:STAS/SEC14 domain-containing protein [candidate division WOR-3 bacterium]|nr:STAS/SEC14 domain-containing protein [candidate division WOR-3 bacterium]